jgi:hypothetical protein
MYACLNAILGSGQTEKGEPLEDQSQSMLIIFFGIKVVHKEFVLASQTVNSSYYRDILRRLYENVRRLRPELL